MEDFSKQIIPYASVDYHVEDVENFNVIITKENIKRTEKNHFHNEVKILYIYEGHGKININGLEIPIFPGSFMILMPYHVHAIAIEKGKEIKYYQCLFSLSLMLFTSMSKKTYVSSMNDIDSTLPVMNLDETTQQSVLFIFEKALEEFKNPITHGKELFYIAVVSAFIFTYERNRNNVLPTDKTLEWQLLQYLHLHHPQKINLERMAKVFHMEKSEINKRLEGMTGFSFAQLLNQARIRNACALMQFEELSVNQISKIIGYNTEAAFYKQFKKIKGTTPNSYREDKKLTKVYRYNDSAKDIFVYINNHFQENITLEKASEDLSIGTKRINELLINNFGFPFKYLLNYTRTVVGANLLKATTLSIKEIGLAIGYQDTRTFTNNFKKIFNQTPIKYRNEWINKND